VAYLRNVVKTFNLLLLICGFLTWILLAIDPVANFENSYIGAILIGVALLNAYIEYFQHAKSAALLDSFLV
jgi:sodium/potassium-transporting ATPase subunit alpha